MKKLIATMLITGLLLFALVSTFFLRIEKSPVENLEEATIKLTFEGEFEIKSNNQGIPKLNWAAVKSLNYPEASGHLEIIEFGASEPFTIGEDEWGNSFVLLNFSEPKIGVNKYKLWTTVKVQKLDITTILPSSEIIPQEFMDANDMVQSEDSKIKNLAVSIVKDSSNQLSKVQDITEWAYQNIVYDRAVENETLDALWTLNNKRGVCVEISHLAEALIRSVGIPARHVYGAAPYNFPVGWQEHTWVESYIGKWVPTDPTWDETEFIDPAHVTFARVPDQTFVEEKVSVSGRNIEMGYMILPKMSVDILGEVRGKEPIVLKLFGKKFKIR
jgi:hypothetical protein